ncbi:hypothetical protein TRSC58_07687 [Trypanosoma rangeli SC58]|uniref:Uncharacterized protein n=1 Tax=Trypanosoma rangeli SC58 TaxID=429131 RepID=A0A061IUP1_TRYRA|nr:hypothetical protein TRSC58_07687 [Trypanosoma rangeli SC58]
MCYFCPFLFSVPVGAFALFGFCSLCTEKAAKMCRCCICSFLFHFMHVCLCVLLRFGAFGRCPVRVSAAIFAGLDHLFIFCLFFLLFLSLSLQMFCSFFFLL